MVTDSPELNKQKHAVVAALIDYDNRLSLHDFRSIACDGFTRVFFDIPLPHDLIGKEKEIKEKAENCLNSLDMGKFEAIITFDSLSFN